MHLKDDHMRNSQLKPAYNLQVAVESEYIVGVDISSETTDMYTLKPFLERLKAITSSVSLMSSVTRDMRVRRITIIPGNR